MGKLTKSELSTRLRIRILDSIAKYLEEQGEQVLSVSGNAIAFPTVDEEGNECFAKLVVSIPRGSRLDGEPYDGFGEATQYQEHRKEVAEKEAKKKKEKELAAKKRAEQLEERRKKKELEAMKKQE